MSQEFWMILDTYKKWVEFLVEFHHFYEFPVWRGSRDMKSFFFKRFFVGVVYLVSMSMPLTDFFSSIEGKR